MLTPANFSPAHRSNHTKSIESKTRSLESNFSSSSKKSQPKNKKRNKAKGEEETREERNKRKMAYFGELIQKDDAKVIKKQEEKFQKAIEGLNMFGSDAGRIADSSLFELNK